MQVNTARRLAARQDCLQALCQQIASCRPEEAFEETGEARVFVASTAYNFLNVFRCHVDHPGVPYRLSTNPLTRIVLETEHAAWRVFAVLSSRLVFWWWYVNCDGFHVPRWFLKSIPFGLQSFSTDQSERLIECGRTLWHSIRQDRVVSLNNGRQTIAYRPFGCETERDAIDSMLVEAAGLQAGFADELRQFVRQMVVVDENDSRRRSLRSHFGAQE